MPATYEPIATTTLSSAAASITFSSISSAYTDLKLIIIPLTTGATEDVWVRFNSDTGTNYSNTAILGDGASATSSRATNDSKIRLDAGTSNASTTPSLRILDIFSYTGSSYKTSLGQTICDKNGSGAVQNRVFLWRNTNAITSIEISLAAGGTNLATNSTATLYGIKSA